MAQWGLQCIHLQCSRHRRLGFSPCDRKIPWRRAWQSTLVFSPEESHVQRSLVGYSPQGLQKVGHDWACMQTILGRYTGVKGPQVLDSVSGVLPAKNSCYQSIKQAKMKEFEDSLFPPFCLRHDWSDLAEKAEREKAYHHHQVVKFPAGYWISYFLSGLEQEGMGREEEISSSVPASEGNECLSWPPGWYDGEKRKVPRHSFPTTTWFGWHLSSHKSSWLKIYTS